MWPGRTGVVLFTTLVSNYPTSPMQWSQYQWDESYKEMEQCAAPVCHSCPQDVKQRGQKVGPLFSWCHLFMRCPIREGLGECIHRWQAKNGPDLLKPITAVRRYGNIREQKEKKESNKECLIFLSKVTKLYAVTKSWRQRVLKLCFQRSSFEFYPHGQQQTAKAHLSKMCTK